MKSFKNLIIIILSLGIGILSGCNRTTEKHPNIVYILADDMGYGDVSCLNPESKISTPNIDRLAGQGVTFTDAHSGSAVCTPTRYGILTGRYCWRSPLKSSVLWAWDGPLIEPGRLTVGGFLKQHGYTTACIGKWHLGWEWHTIDGSELKDSVAPGDFTKPQIRTRFGHKVDLTKSIENGPVTKGFDYYFGNDSPVYCFIENDSTLGIPVLQKPENMFGTPGPMIEGWEWEAVMPALTEKAVEYVRGKKEESFFLYFSLTAPHTPIAPTDEFKGKSNAGAYGDFVQQVDWTVGQILGVLEEEGLAENTLVIFTSDNGSPGRDGTNMTGTISSVRKFGHNPSYIFRGTKADIFEGGHHIPFIARWPGKINPGSKSDEIICLTDLVATCAAILGESLPPDAGEDSYNILPAMLGQAYEGPIREATIHHSSEGCFSVRQGKWKLILCGGSGGWSHPRTEEEAAELGLPGVQLYDLESDIGEQHNVQEQYPGVVEKLTGLLQKYVDEGRSTPSAIVR